ncbi:MYG1 exonuclease-like isoform X3 [Lytechinus variegatus]|uniref:MYG1 exonuclease-like isoform X3 n=1 Tax=Lytechinus variegatus TaxID=7654 RepID=UPI001BB16201|nr:MYG1 exonuclease-like isoform X3 [Lytechinus variegatus]
MISLSTTFRNVMVSCRRPFIGIFRLHLVDRQRISIRHQLSKFLLRNCDSGQSIMTDCKRSCVRIGTHNGTFHCDESLACFMLQQLHQYKNSEIIRTRDPALLEICDIVVDVGGVYDPSRHRYDHHQRSFSDTMNSLNPELPWTIKLSSAGLVYYHFGKQVISTTLDLSPDDPDVTSIYNKVYENFLQEVDAIDNGINQTDEKPRYAVTTNLSSRVAHLNPSWNDTQQDFESGFLKAVALTGEEFLDRINYYAKVWLPARSVVKTALQDRFNVDACGEIITFPQGGCPWKEHLFELEQVLELDLPIKYVLYPDSNGAWRIQCVPINKHSFENRLSLPEKWRGIRDEALSEITGIYGCIFVHAGGFIGGNKSKEGALQMARKSLQLGQEMD